MSLSKSSKLLNYINFRMRVTLLDGRQIVGRFMAFDRHLNLVLGDSEEFRRLPPKKGKADEGEREDRRVLGLMVLRGEEILSLTIEGPPPQEAPKAAAGMGGPGMGRAVGRGMPVAAPGHAPPGLAGPARGVGGPSPGMMMPRPQMSAPPMMRPPPGMMPPPGGPPGMPPPGYRPGMPPPPGMPPTGMMPPGMPPGFRPGMPPPGAPGMPPPPGMPPAGMMPPGMPPGFRPGMPPGMPQPPQ